MMVAFVNMYGPDWDIEALFKHVNIRLGHPALRELDASEAVRRTAAFIQAWLYFGLLEAIIAKPISSTYMIRADGNCTEYLYSRTLPVLLGFWAKRLLMIETEFRETALQLTRECALRASFILVEIITEASHHNGHEPLSELKSLLLSIEPTLTALHEAIAGFAKPHLN